MGSEDRERYCCESEVMGYHIYQDIWEARHGEILNCFRETGNAFNPFTVCVKKDAVVVGHVPRKISSISLLFLRNNGTIHCEVTGKRRYSRGIPQGGLEIPCSLVFEGPKKYIDTSSRKIARLRNTKDKPASDDHREETKEPAKVEATTKVVDPMHVQESKQHKLCHVKESEEKNTGGLKGGRNAIWVQIISLTLKIPDRALLLTKEEMTDMHVNVAQKLLLYQFPTYQGLKNTLMQQCIGFWVNN